MDRSICALDDKQTLISGRERMGLCVAPRSGFWMSQRCFWVQKHETAQVREPGGRGGREQALFGIWKLPVVKQTWLCLPPLELCS